MAKVKTNELKRMKVKPLKTPTVVLPPPTIRTITFSDEFLLKNRNTCFALRADRWVECKACGASFGRWSFKEQDEHVQEHKTFLNGKRKPRQDRNDPLFREPNWGFLPMKDLILAVDTAYGKVQEIEDEKAEKKLQKIFMHGATRLWDKYADEAVDTEKIRTLKGRSIYCDGVFHFVSDNDTDNLRDCFPCDCV